MGLQHEKVASQGRDKWQYGFMAGVPGGDTPSLPSVQDPAVLREVSLSDVPVFCLCES